MEFHTYFFKINYFSKILPIKSNYLEIGAKSHCFPEVEMPLFFVRKGKSVLHLGRNNRVFHKAPLPKNRRARWLCGMMIQYSL